MLDSTVMHTCSITATVRLMLGCHPFILDMTFLYTLLHYFHLATSFYHIYPESRKLDMLKHWTSWMHHVAKSQKPEVCGLSS